MFGIRGVDIHSQLRTIFIIATHQLNTYLTNPLPLFPSLSFNPSPNPPLNPIPTYLISSYIILQSSSNHPLSFAHRSLLHTPPLISHNIISPNIHPHTTLYIPKNTHHTQIIPNPKASFCHKKSIITH